MLANIFITARLEPSVHIGGVMVNAESQYLIGKNDYFITEACEYKRSLLHLFPDTAVVLNIAMDHPDCYKDITDVAAAFKEFLSNIKKGGSAVLNGDDALLAGITQGDATPPSPCVIFFGLKKHNNFRADGITGKNGRYSFDLIENGKKLCRLSLQVPGRYNIYNALAAAASARIHGVSADGIKKGLEAFRGIKRRFEYWGEIQGAAVYHDYAHHPQEIAAVLKAARHIASGRILCVFQPHTYSRTKRLFDKFVKALIKTDICILAQIYAARETPLAGITSGALADAVNNFGEKNAKELKAQACADFNGICVKIKEQAREGDIILILGAGDIENLKEFLF